MSSTPKNVTLLPGSMQSWSDLDHEPAGSTAAARAHLRALVDGVRRVAVVGPHATDLLTGLADLVPELTVIVRSVPDANTIGELLQENCGASVFACDLTKSGPDAQYDLVIALDDVTRISSAETAPATWTQVFERLTALVADGGSLALVTENELGLHRMTAVRSRFTANENADWSPTETFDISRPRDPQALSEAIGAAGLTVDGEGAVLPTWDDQTVWVAGADRLDASGQAVLGAVTLAAPTFRRVGSDPTRLTRAAVLGNRLPQVASGWWVVATRGAGNSPAPADSATIVASSVDGQVHEFSCGATELTCDGRSVRIPSGAAPFGEMVLDAAADGDLSVVRALVSRLAPYIDARSVDGSVDAAFADARPDNLLATDDELIPVVPATDSADRDEVVWRALADIVHVIRARGARHPWPSATDDQTMFASLAAMAGVAVPDDIEPWLARPVGGAADAPVADVSGLIAVVERLTETNKALGARATWYEQRLASTERDLRVRTERHRAQLAAAVRQQEVLRGSAEDLRRSLTYRMGNALLGPARTLRNRTRD